MRNRVLFGGSWRPRVLHQGAFKVVRIVSERQQLKTLVALLEPVDQVVLADHSGAKAFQWAPAALLANFARHFGEGAGSSRVTCGQPLLGIDQPTWAPARRGCRAFIDVAPTEPI